MVLPMPKMALPMPMMYESLLSIIGDSFPNRALVVVMPTPRDQRWREDMEDLCESLDDELRERTPPGPVADQVLGRHTVVLYQEGIIDAAGTLTIPLRAPMSLRLDELDMSVKGGPDLDVHLMSIDIGLERVFDVSGDGVPLYAFRSPLWQRLLRGRCVMAGCDVVVTTKVSGPCAVLMTFTGSALYESG